MGWELRKGHRYYYIARKLDGRVVRKYVLRGSSPLAGNAEILLADGERHLREAREAKRRASLERPNTGRRRFTSGRSICRRISRCTCRPEPGK